MLELLRGIGLEADNHTVDVGEEGDGVHDGALDREDPVLDQSPLEDQLEELGLEDDFSTFKLQGHFLLPVRFHLNIKLDWFLPDILLWGFDNRGLNPVPGRKHEDGRGDERNMVSQLFVSSILYLQILEMNREECVYPGLDGVIPSE